MRGAINKAHAADSVSVPKVFSKGYFVAALTACHDIVFWVRFHWALSAVRRSPVDPRAGTQHAAERRRSRSAGTGVVTAVSEM